jgi:hypothetical protein
MKKIIKLTEQDLEQIIRKVLNEQAIPGTSRPEDMGYLRDINPSNLKLGDKGEEVKVLQQKLMKIGLLKTKSMKPTGYFGTLTNAALSKYLSKPKATPKVVPKEKIQKSKYNLTPRIDKELGFIKQRGMDNKPFFIYDPLQNLIYLFNKGGVLVDYTSVVDGQSEQQKGKEYSFAQWCKDSGVSHIPSVCTDVNVKTAEDCAKQPAWRSAKWTGTYCTVKPSYGSLPVASRFFPKGIYDVRYLKREEGYVGAGKNTFYVGREGEKGNVPNAIHGIPKSEERLRASNELEKYLQKNVESGQVPEKYLNNTKSISKANQSFGCVGVPAKFIENPKVQSLSLGARLFVMGDNGKDFLVQNSGEFFNKLGGTGENCVNPESLASRMSTMA